MCFLVVYFMYDVGYEYFGLCALFFIPGLEFVAGNVKYFISVLVSTIGLISFTFLLNFVNGTRGTKFGILNSICCSWF